MAYLLDSNVFIEAKQRYYAFEICPGFWDWLAGASADGRVFSIEKVRDELIAGEDALTEWARSEGADLFLPVDEPMLRSLVAAIEWSRSRPYRQAAISSFADSADAYLIAYAHSHDHTVVTHERPSDGIRDVKIPDACVGMGVKWISPFDMLRREGARFELA